MSPDKSTAASLEWTIKLRWSNTKGEDTAVRNAQAVIAKLGELGVRNVADVDQPAIAKLVALLRAEDSPATVNRKLASLRCLLATARELGWSAVDLKIPRMKEGPGRSRLLLPAEEVILFPQIARVSGDAFRLATFLLATGCRLGEALGMRAQDYAPTYDDRRQETGLVTFRDTKSGENRTVPVASGTCEVISRQRLESEKDVGTRGFWRLGRKDFYKAWDQAKRLAHMDDDDSEFVPHMLRHTCATRLINRGVPVPVVAKLLGHRNIRTTMRYVHVTQEELQKWMG